MIRQFLVALVPTTQQAMNAWFFTMLLLGIFAGLLAFWWISEIGIDLAIAWWARRQPDRPKIVDIDARRRQLHAAAIGTVKR